MSKWNYFNLLYVDGYDFPTVPQINFTYTSQGFSFLNRGNSTLQYSFNGEDLHGDLVPSDASAGFIFDARSENKVWFRAYDGYGEVRVESWGKS